MSTAITTLGTKEEVKMPPATKTNGPDWRWVAIFALAIVSTFGGVIWQMQSGDIEKLEDAIRKVDDSTRVHDSAIVEIKTDVGYIKRSLDDLRSDMHRVLSLVEKK